MSVQELLVLRGGTSIAERRVALLSGCETGDRASRVAGDGWTEKRNPFLQRSHGVSVLVF